MGIDAIEQMLRTAIGHHTAGRLPEAEAIYRQVLARQPNHPDGLHLLGVLVGQIGRPADAIELIGRAIAISPSVAQYHNNLGNLLREDGQIRRAVSAYQTAIHLRPDYAEALNNLGIALCADGQFDEAIATYKAAIRLKPRGAEIHNNLGVALREKGLMSEAIAAHRTAIDLDLGSSEAHNNLGIALRELRRIPEAIDAHQKAIELQPSSAQAYNNLGIALAANGQIAEAVAAYEAAIRLNPNDAEAFSNLGNALGEQGQTAAAIDHYRRAIELKPGYAVAYTNLGVALGDIGLFDESLAACRRAVEIEPNLAQAHWNLALILLLLGDFERGWAEYEWRWKCNPHSPPRLFSKPRWDGHELKGEIVLLHAEQGMGDTLQFVRYAPLVAGRGARVVMECQPELCRLLKGVAGIEQVVTRGEPLPAFDLHCPLLSLPRIFATALDSIPAQIPYVVTEPAQADAWRRRLAVSRDRLNVGLVWGGRAEHGNDRNRSIPLSRFEPLAGIDGITFFSLQKGPAAAQALKPPSGMRLIDYTSELNDFADTAALIANLDLVISVDTAVAHLTGAMGKPVWTLLPYRPDWRWHLLRKDTPWYPTLRLFRQEEPGTWPEIIEQVAQSLQGHVRQKVGQDSLV